jgi:multimeric flavodoxin WrbA
MNDLIDRVVAADGLVIAAPTYFANVPANVKAVIERLGYVNIANGGMLKRKVGAAAIVARRGGAIDAFNAVNHLFLHAQMIVPGSSYWNMGYGWHGQEVKDDAEAERTMRTLGQNIAWLLGKIHA